MSADVAEPRLDIPAAAVARAAEAVVPMLRAHPELIASARPYIVQPSVVDTIFAVLDQNKDGVLTLAELGSNAVTAPFVPFVSTRGPFGAAVDAQIAITRDQLRGAPALLFSYDALRTLSTFYSTNDGVAQSLAAKLQAAQAADERGNSAAKAGLLRAFINEVRAHESGAFTAPQAEVLITLARTLLPG